MRVDILKCLALIGALLGTTPRTMSAIEAVGTQPVASTQRDTLTVQALRHLRLMERAATREVVTPRSRYSLPDIRALRAMVPEHVALVERLLQQYSTEVPSPDAAHREEGLLLQRDLAEMAALRTSRVPGFLRGHAGRLRRFIREHQKLVGTA